MEAQAQNATAQNLPVVTSAAGRLAPQARTFPFDRLNTSRDPCTELVEVKRFLPAKAL